MARLDVRYTYRKTAVCLPLLRWAWLYVYIKAILAKNKFCKYPDENLIIWFDCIWASAVNETYFWYLPIVQKHSSHVELAISRTVGKSSSLDLACFVQAPEGVWTRAMFGTSSTKSDSSIFIKLLASRTFFAHFALNLKWSPIVLCLKVPSRPKSFEDLIFNIYGSNWPSLSSVGHLLHIFGPLSTHKLASPNHFSTFLRCRNVLLGKLLRKPINVREVSYQPLQGVSVAYMAWLYKKIN